MHVSSGESSVVRRSVYRLYMIMVSLIFLGIVTEGVLIGPSLFAATRWGRTPHFELGVLLLLLTLLLPVVGRFARLPGRMVLLSVVLFVLALIGVTAAGLGHGSPLLAALHPANAMLMVALTVVLLSQGWPLMWERKGEMKPS